MSRVVLEYRLPSAANMREHWRSRHRRAKTQRLMGRIMVSTMTGVWPAAPEPGTVVTLTRIAPCPLDDDNLAAAFKAVRDGIADGLGIRDNDPRVSWRYAQRRGKPREYAIEADLVIAVPEAS